MAAPVVSACVKQIQYCGFFTRYKKFNMAAQVLVYNNRNMTSPVLVDNEYIMVAPVLFLYNACTFYNKFKIIAFVPVYS